VEIVPTNVQGLHVGIAHSDPGRVVSGVEALRTRSPVRVVVAAMRLTTVSWLAKAAWRRERLVYRPWWV